MSALGKRFMRAVGVTALAISAFTVTAFAQNSSVSSDPAKSLMEQGAVSDPVSAAAKKKADAAMTVAPNPTPLTHADKKAAAAMEMGSNPAPTK